MWSASQEIRVTRFAQPTINPLACCICWTGWLGRAVIPPWNEGPNFGSYKNKGKESVISFYKKKGFKRRWHEIKCIVEMLLRGVTNIWGLLRLSSTQSWSSEPKTILPVCHIINTSTCLTQAHTPIEKRKGEVLKTICKQPLPRRWASFSDWGQRMTKIHSWAEE